MAYIQLYAEAKKAESPADRYSKVWFNTPRLAPRRFILYAAIFVCGFALGASGIYVLPLLGFFLAILWPTVMTIGRFCSEAPVMTGAIITIAAAFLIQGFSLLWGTLTAGQAPAGVTGAACYSPLYLSACLC